MRCSEDLREQQVAQVVASVIGHNYLVGENMGTSRQGLVCDVAREGVLGTGVGLLQSSGLGDERGDAGSISFHGTKGPGVAGY